jgi:hypothetical protein
LFAFIPEDSKSRVLWSAASGGDSYSAGPFIYVPWWRSLTPVEGETMRGVVFPAWAWRWMRWTRSEDSYHPCRIYIHYAPAFQLVSSSNPCRKLGADLHNTARRTARDVCCLGQAIVGTDSTVKGTTCKCRHNLLSTSVRADRQSTNENRLREFNMSELVEDACKTLCARLTFETSCILGADGFHIAYSLP